MKSIGVDLSNIEITINCSPEQFKSQVTASALRLLCNKKPADLVCGNSGSQRVSRRRSEGCGGVKGEDTAALRDLSITSIPDQTHLRQRKRSIDRAAA